MHAITPAFSNQKLTQSIVSIYKRVYKLIKLVQTHFIENEQNQLYTLYRFMLEHMATR